MFRNPGDDGFSKSTDLSTFLRFLLGGAAAFLPSPNGGKMRSRPNRPDQDPLGTKNKQRASR